MMIYRDLIVLIIAFTCVGVFVATAIASMLDLFNLLKLAPDIRRKLHIVLIVEIVGIAVAVFGGFLNPAPIAQSVERQRLELERQITDSTEAVLRANVDGGTLTQELGGDEVVTNFPWVDTASAPGNLVAAAPYLHGAGISVGRITPERSEVVLINNRVVYEGRAVAPTISQNFLTQINTNNRPASFTLSFAEPFASVRFVRPALYPDTASGITHPAWSAHALNASGQEVASESEDLVRSFSNVPARTYTLTTPRADGISAIRFESDPRLAGQPFAAFNALLIEQLTMIR